MGFSIGRLLGGIAPILGGALGSVIPVVGTALGTVLGGAVGAAFGPGSSSPSQVGPTVRAALPALVAPSMARGAIALAMTAAGVVAEMLLRAGNNTGRRVTRQQVVDAVKFCGIATTAGMFGLSESEICTIVITGKRRRRSRGISAADLRRTRSTIRKVHNISHDLRALVPRVRAHHK